MNAILRSLALVVALFGGSACIIEADNPPPRQCSSGHFACSNDDTVDVCDRGRWEIYEDCWDLCNGPGFCDYDYYGDPVCFCD